MATLSDLENAIDALLNHPLGIGRYQLVRLVEPKAYYHRMRPFLPAPLAPEPRATGPGLLWLLPTLATFYRKKWVPWRR